MGNYDKSVFHNLIVIKLKIDPKKNRFVMLCMKVKNQLLLPFKR